MIIKYKKERKGRNWSFFLQEKGSVPRTCCWRRRWAPWTCTCDDLSTTTHPLQHRGLELDKQETSATEVCESSFSFSLREKGSAPRTCCWRRWWAPRTCTYDDLSTTTHPLQHRGLELEGKRQALLKCVSPRSVSTSWGRFGYWLAVEG
jgi:hypothetical protein